MSNYESMKQRIQSASKDYSMLRKLEVSTERLYNAGIFTTSDFRRLDSMILNHMVKLDINKED